MDFRIAVSCDALLDGIDEGHTVPGICFDFVKTLHDWSVQHGAGIIVSVVSTRSPSDGAAIVRTLGDLGLDRATGFFSGGASVLGYLKAIAPDMYLGSAPIEVQAAIDLGIPAAVMHGVRTAGPGEQLRIAFDGDGVLFSPETEKFYQENGIKAFLSHERENAHVPMQAGPLLPLLRALDRIRIVCGPSSLRVALVTARSGSACERPIRTLEHLGVTIDEVLFCGDIPKTELLRAFGAHVFFDDSERHVGPAAEHMPTGHVLWPAMA